MKKLIGLFVILGFINLALAEDIALCEGPWTGSAVNAYVAKAILEDMGHDVEIIQLDENSAWAALASGELSACLEVWPSGHAENIAQYIDNGLVNNIGELGVEGKIGWWMPAYMLDEHPELATWEGFLDPDNAALFATAQTGDRGAFFGGDPSFVQYDGDIIENLGMNLEVVFAGSEAALIAGLDSAYSRNDPYLFYMWSPHSLFANYDIVEVELPAYSDECYAKEAEGGIDCGYPVDVLFKIANPELENDAPDAYAMLSNMSYSAADQISMISAVEDGGQSPEEAAQAWLDANEDTWKAWLP